MLRVCLFILAIVSFEASAVTVIYGIDNLKTVKARRNQEYLLQLGAFSSSHNAQDYFNKIKKTLNHQDKFYIAKQKNGLYSIVFGPTKDVHSLQQIPHHRESKSVVVHPMKTPTAIVAQAKTTSTHHQKPPHPDVFIKTQSASDLSADTIEAQARQLYIQSAALDEKIKHAKNEKELFAYKQEQAQVNSKLDNLVNRVISRVGKAQA